jgi:hypothetical protein
MDRKKGLGLAEELIASGARLAIEAAERLLSDPRGREALARASELAQKAVQGLEDLAGRAAHAAGIPGEAEYRELQERLARIQEKAAELQARLDAMEKGEKRAPEGSAGGAQRARWRDPEDPDLR